MQPTSQNKQRRSAGFTLVEMLVVAPFVLLIIGGFIALIITLTGQVLSQSGQNKLVYDTQNAFDRFNQDASRASAFRKIGATPSSPQGADDDSKPFNTYNSQPGDSGATYGTIAIFSQQATTKSPTDDSRQLVYSTAPSESACGTATENQNAPYNVEIVYYLKTDGSDTSIWRRTMFDAGQTPCSGSTVWQRASCAPGVTNAICKADDELVLDHVSDVAIVYLKNGANGLSATNTIDFGSFVDCINPCTQDPSNPTVPFSISNKYDPFSPAGDNAKNMKLYIKTERTIAGRDLSYEDALYSLRRSDRQTSVRKTVAPETPSVSAGITNETSARFYWPSVAGADSYSIRYRTNGGSWTNVNNVKGTSYTVTASRGDSVSMEVTAKNYYGTSGAGSATFEIPGWKACSFQNGWTNYSTNYASASYIKTSAEVVVLKGLVKSGSIGSSSSICQLPAGFRPDHRLIFQVPTYNNTFGRVDITTDGYVIANIGSSTWMSLSGITFLPDSTYIWTHLDGTNGWTDYGGSYSPVGVAKDSLGRIHIQGLARGGATSSGTNAFDFDIDDKFDTLELYPASSGNYVNGFRLNNYGIIETRGQSYNTYWSLQAMVYPNTLPDNWTTVSSQNGWVQYSGSYPNTGYRKSADGIVSLHGLVKNGNQSGNVLLFTLPTGYRPSKINLCGTIAGDEFARIDVYPNGNVYANSVPKNNFLSLAGCDFVADQ